MNDQRQRNTEFLLAIGDDDERFDKFVQSLPLEDVYYALELLHEYASKLLVEELEANDCVKDVSEASNVLNKIMRGV